MKISVRGKPTKKTKKPQPTKKALPAPPLNLWGQDEDALSQCGYEWGEILREIRLSIEEDE